MENVVRQIPPENIIGITLKREHHWDQVAAYVETVLSQKKEAEYHLARAADERRINGTILKYCES